MFFFKKVLTPFLLPPGIFILILMGTGLWLLYKNHLKSALVNLGVALALWALSTIAVSNLLMSGLESKYQAPTAPQGDVIVVLGGGVYETVPDFSGIGAPSDEMLSRLVTAARVQKKLNLPIIISGGSVFPGRTSEAVIDRRFLLDLGVPAEKILMEENSRDTLENAQYVKELCARHQFKQPLLVTSAYHMERALWSFAKAGMNVTPYPANYHTSKNQKYNWNDFLPRDLRDTYAALHEYLGLAYYKMAY